MGPYEEEQVLKMVQTGILQDHDLYWHEGMLDWSPLATLIVGTTQHNTITRDNTATPPVDPWPTPILPQSQIIQGGTEPLATWSLVLGLLGLLCMGMLAGIPAIVCGHLALSNINRNNLLNGRGSATAGLILGYLSSIFWLLFVLSFITHLR